MYSFNLNQFITRGLLTLIAVFTALSVSEDVLASRDAPTFKIHTDFGLVTYKSKFVSSNDTQPQTFSEQDLFNVVERLVGGSQ